ncbi:MAG: hypothetical protein LBT00_10895 [Spirochaetaceae bacterium]|nr:hypothetical protein [Spirochaetaceae bacterium]
MPFGVAIPTDCRPLNGTRSKRRALWRGDPCRLPLAQQYPPKGGVLFGIVVPAG